MIVLWITCRIVSARSAARRFLFERKLVAQGINVVAGVDEAGRGPLAGPVVAAAVALPTEWIQGGMPRELRGLNDSKQLRSEQREQFFSALTRNSLVNHAVVSLDSLLVDDLNILRATHRAMNEALTRLVPEPRHILVDGLPVKSLPFPQTAIVGGDARSYSIAAASVIAKVTRDRLMIAYHEQWPVYGFAVHKGYGTPQHLSALAAHGPCPIHRRSFSPVKQPDLFTP